jgi:hypothetical protein
MATISGSVSLSATLTQSKVTTSGDVSTNLTTTVKESLTYKNGTAAAQLDLLYNNTYTISGTTTIDLTALADNVTPGVTNSFARVREFIVINQSSSNDLKVYQAASNGWASLPPSGNPLYARAGNGVVYLADRNSSGTGVGMVTGTTNKSVTFDPNGATITFNLVLAGCSVA